MMVLAFERCLGMSCPTTRIDVRLWSRYHHTSTSTSSFAHRGLPLQPLRIGISLVSNPSQHEDRSDLRAAMIQLLQDEQISFVAIWIQGPWAAGHVRSCRPEGAKDKRAADLRCRQWHKALNVSGFHQQECFVAAPCSVRSSCSGGTSGCHQPMQRAGRLVPATFG